MSALTWEQLADIHTGKITNWKQVGGKDAPIVVYSDALTGGTRALVKKVVLKDAEYAPSVKSLTSVARVAELVASDPNGVGAVGRGFVAIGKPWRRWIQEGVRVGMSSEWNPERGKLEKGKFSGDGLYGLAGIGLETRSHGARAWTDATPIEERVATLAPVSAYRPGAFFERELPCILEVLARLESAP